MEKIDQEESISNILKKVTVRKMFKGEWTNRTISVVQEIPLTIFLNDKEIVTLLCMGSHLEALTVGFLKFEGLIDKREDIRDITLDEKKGLITINLE